MTGVSPRQISTWLSNTRMRIWRPVVEGLQTQAAAEGICGGAQAAAEGLCGCATWRPDVEAPAGAGAPGRTGMPA
jgi:hypothetical protein